VINKSANPIPEAELRRRRLAVENVLDRRLVHHHDALVAMLVPKALQLSAADILRTFCEAGENVDFLPFCRDASDIRELAADFCGASLTSSPAWPGRGRSSWSSTGRGRVP
jgi:hypothetical protein